MPAETYGSTQTRGQHEHVVYVSVGNQRQRFGENKMGQMAMAVLGLTLVACLVYSAATEERHYAAYTPATGLAQRKVMTQDITKMESLLAAKEVHKQVLELATKNLPPTVKAVAAKLAQNAPTSKLIDCSKLDAYKFLQDTFAGLKTNITAHNASIFAEDQKLESAYTVAYNAWQSQEAAYRTAQSAHESAKEAAEYAKGKFDEYTSALSAAEAERDSTIPGLETEKEELVAQQPILEQVKTLVANMASGAEAKSRVQFLKQLPAIAKLADSIVPTENRAIASKVKAMKTQLAETATSSTVTKMLVVIDGIITTMAARIVEIGENIQRISDSVNDNSAKLSEWQTKLVDLSEEKDKAANVENTADLERSQLNGENVVAEEAYNDYHAGFVDEAEKLTKQVAALVTIGGKIDEAISSCSAE